MRIEHLPSKQRVTGSSPVGGIFFDVGAGSPSLPQTESSFQNRIARRGCARTGGGQTSKYWHSCRRYRSFPGGRCELIKGSGKNAAMRKSILPAHKWL
jgi:hypothetical protein